MHDIDLGGLDLNLLVTLDVLLEERSVSATAARIGRTQSATSHALARLRDQLDDPLLVRVGSGMQPTPRALSLAGDLKRALRSLQRILARGPAFDPARSEREFTVAGPDFLTSQLPALIAAVLEHAPQARVEFVEPRRAMFRELLDENLDLVVAPPPSRPAAGITHEPLLQSPWVVFARRGHPSARRLGPRSWARAGHARVRTPGESGPVDRAAKRAGLCRTVVANLPNFHAAASVLARTDLLLTAPRVALGDLVERFELVELRCPLDLPPIELHVIQAAHLGRDPAIAFFADRVRATLR